MSHQPRPDWAAAARVAPVRATDNRMCQDDLQVALRRFSLIPNVYMYKRKTIYRQV
jgi:hypothetical protein